MSFLLKIFDNNEFRANPDTRVSFDMLSESDKEALDFIVEKFGKMGPWKLKDYTHQYPEWYQYEDLFTNKLTKRERIETKELLSTIKDDPLTIPSRKHIKESEKILTGNFDWLWSLRLVLLRKH